MVTLPVFLRRAAARHIVWGEWDCGLWLADWYMAVSGFPDPASDLRGRYHTREECLALCGPLGFPRMIQRIAKRARLERTHTPFGGDIGVLRTRPGDVAIGAIKKADGWAFLSLKGGIASIRDDEPALRPMAAWRI